MPVISSIMNSLIRLHHNRLAFILVVLLLLPIVGSVGYMLIEGWPWFDALYMTIITLTTVGYTEVHPLSPAGRLFTIVFIFFGVGTVFYSLTILAEMMLRSDRMRQHLTKRMLRIMDNHYIVCGYGRTGKRVAAELEQLGKSYVVVDIQADKLAEIERQGKPIVVGDAADEHILRSAGIDKAAGLVAALDNDAANVFAVLTARELHESLHIVARAENVSAEPKLKRAGANAILSPYEIGAQRLTHMLLQRSMIDSFELVTNKIAVDISIEEFRLEPSHGMCNRTLAALDLRKNFNAIVLAIKHPNESIDFPPDPQTVLQPGAVLIVAATGDQMQKVFHYFLTSTVNGG